MLDDSETNIHPYDTGITVLSAIGPAETVRLRFRPDQVRMGEVDNDTHSPKFASQGAMLQTDYDTELNMLHREKAAAEAEFRATFERMKNLREKIAGLIRRQHRSGFDMREKALAAIDAQIESLKRKREIILAEMNQ